LAAVGACLLLAGDVVADATRFIPWKEPGAPALTLTDLAGRTHTLADHRGRVVLVNFWATWCEPCREELASIGKLQQQLAGRPFEVVLVNYGESRTRVVDFATRERIGFHVLLDPNREAPRAWRVRVLPTSFLVDPDGQVRYSVLGEIDWATADSANIVRSLAR
jgi:thiol-disulfide isomerase/thioredoxin